MVAPINYHCNCAFEAERKRAFPEIGRFSRADKVAPLNQFGELFVKNRHFLAKSPMMWFTFQKRGASGWTA
jgi:hypothetical protein